MEEFKVKNGKGIIPEGATEIPDGAFANCENLTGIGIPASVKKIGNDAFKGCTGLEYVEIGKFVQEIGDRVFEGCTSLTGIVIPDSVKKIGIAFNKCPNLRTVCIKDAKILDNTGLPSSGVKIINPLASEEEKKTWNAEELNLAIDHMFLYLGEPVGESDSNNN